MNKLAMLFCACFLGSCSSTKPADVGVDEEAVLVDLDACMSDPSCHSADVVPADYVLPGAKAILVPHGGKIVAPVRRPASAKTLAYLVLGVGSPGNGEALDVTIDCFPSSKPCPPLHQKVAPYIGPNRTEIQLASPPTDVGDRITIENQAADPFFILWVVGRWGD